MNPNDYQILSPFSRIVKSNMGGVDIYYHVIGGGNNQMSVIDPNEGFAYTLIDSYTSNYGLDNTLHIINMRTSEEIIVPIEEINPQIGPPGISWEGMAMVTITGGVIIMTTYYNPHPAVDGICLSTVLNDGTVSSIVEYPRPLSPNPRPDPDIGGLPFINYRFYIGKAFTVDPETYSYSVPVAGITERYAGDPKVYGMGVLFLDIVDGVITPRAENFDSLGTIYPYTESPHHYKDVIPYPASKFLVLHDDETPATAPPIPEPLVDPFTNYVSIDLWMDAMSNYEAWIWFFDNYLLVPEGQDDDDAFRLTLRYYYHKQSDTIKAVGGGLVFAHGGEPYYDYPKEWVCLPNQQGIAADMTEHVVPLADMDEITIEGVFNIETIGAKNWPTSALTYYDTIAGVIGELPLRDDLQF